MKQKKDPLRHFAYEHLPLHLREIGRQFHVLAREMIERFPAGSQRMVGLQRLLEAKDCFVRAAVDERNAALGPYDGKPIPPGRFCELPLDPISGNPLPPGSPYSQAHEVVRQAGEPVSEKFNWFETGVDVSTGRKWIRYGNGRKESHLMDCKITGRTPCTCNDMILIKVGYDNNSI